MAIEKDLDYLVAEFEKTLPQPSEDEFVTYEIAQSKAIYGRDIFHLFSNAKRDIIDGLYIDPEAYSKIPSLKRIVKGYKDRSFKGLEPYLKGFERKGKLQAIRLVNELKNHAKLYMIPKGYDPKNIKKYENKPINPSVLKKSERVRLLEEEVHAGLSQQIRDAKAGYPEEHLMREKAKLEEKMTQLNTERAELKEIQYK